MERWRRDGRRETVIVDLDELVPQDHLLRKIERIMDYEWLYERLEILQFVRIEGFFLFSR